MCGADKLNAVKFDPIEAGVVRLEVELQPDFSGASKGEDISNRNLFLLVGKIAGILPTRLKES